jgi:flagellar motor protein MotB
VKAEVDFTAGVLRLPDEVLFDKGKDEPSAKGIAALGVLADALSLNLPCYAYREKARDPTVCEPSAHNLEAIFVEGHTDSDPISPSARIRDNWDLSAARATNTFRILVLEKPELNAFLSAKPGTKEAKPVLSVAAYADQRPIQSGTQEAAKRLNRRIDVRFLMVGPKSPNSP